MDITPEQVRAHRLRAHHLDRRYPASRILEAAGACGLQNSPPGGWETALFQRLVLNCSPNPRTKRFPEGSLERPRKQCRCDHELF